MSAIHGVSRRGFVMGTMGLVALRAMGAEEKKAVWRIGCYTRPWAAWEYGVALDAIAEAGYKYAGLMTTKGGNGLVLSVATSLEQAQRIGEEAKKRGLGLPSVYGGDIPVSRGLEAGIEGMKKLIDNCAAAGVGNLMMGGVGDAKIAEVYYRTIKECCDYAAEKKVGVSVKPHGGTNSTGPQCRKIIESVGKRNFGLWYDPGNIFYYSDGKLDPAEDAGTVDGIVAGMSVKDYVHPKKVDVTPGEGQVDFKKVMEKLKKGGFVGGPLVVECLKGGDQKQLIVEARKAREFLERLVG